MKKYFVLALYLEGSELRALTSISYNTINFNISGWKEFEDISKIDMFRKIWNSHFFGLWRLETVKVTERAGGTKTMERVS
jgi:hypothetical protein